VDEDSVRKFVEIGVKDSKLLSKKQRVKLRDRILRIVSSYRTIEVPPSEIDSAVRIHRFNDLEARYFSEVIDQLKPDIAYVDSPLRSHKKFSAMVTSHCRWRCDIVALCHADRDIPVVSAASIVAKIRRDDIIDSYKNIYGEIGSGYPSDKRTIRFLYNSLEEAEAGGIVRRSWRTYSSIIRMKRQVDIYRYLG
ncbi:MAG: ribonuclease HII, partial [Candidatus Bathyarchaeia archaeon]